MSDKFRIKPLSEGLGLGSLRTPTPRMTRELPPMDIPIKVHAQDVYRKQSVGVAMKKAPKARAKIWFAEAVVGWGLDAIMVAVTIVMCSILGTMAWRFGSGTETRMDPVSSIKIISDFIQSRGPGFVAAGFIISWFLYWAVMKLFVGSTLGNTISRPRSRSS